MSSKTICVRRAKLEFALVKGDSERIAEAEKKLKEAIEEHSRKTSVRRRPQAENGKN
jgi:hypothetical protein